MSAIVVDASVGIKWFLPEVHSAEARLWRSAPSELHTLAVFFDIEIASVLWKRIQRAEITEADATAILAQVEQLPLLRHLEMPPAALKLAAQTQRTVYDCLYLALALELGGKMLTADLRLYNSLQATPWGAHLIWVGDLPQTV